MEILRNPKLLVCKEKQIVRTQKIPRKLPKFNTNPNLKYYNKIIVENQRL
jgi:hypothetical protein